MTPLPIIEKLSIVAPLGVCFHDTATGTRVTDGLNVTVYPAGRKKGTETVPNRNGVYVLHKISGLEDFSRGSGDDEFWNSQPQKLYNIEVFDQEKRFQPFQFEVDLPVRGLFQWENLPVGSPNKNLSSIPLYSAPTRRNPGGMSVIRAQLREIDGRPAASAVLEAYFAGNLIARGLADGDGQTVLMFPALSPQTNPITSPPGNATRVVLADQQWVLDLQVKYQPGIFQASPSVESGEDFPDIRLALAQANGRLWADSGQTSELTTATLRLGRELVLRSLATVNASPPTAPESPVSSYLFVSPVI